MTAFPLGLTSLGHGEHILSDNSRTPTGTPLSLGGIKSGAGALHNHVSLRLSRGNHHRKEELALPLGRVVTGESSREEAQSDSTRVQIFSDR